MPFYQITYKDPKGIKWDQYLIEDVSHAKAKERAAHKVDGSYGKTDLKLHEVVRVSKARAEVLQHDCVNWTNSLQW